MASVASQLIEEVTAHAQRESLEDAQEICADGTYFPNNLRFKGMYTECPRRNVPDFGRLFLMLKYTDITQNTYVQS